jgi:hypothetical protein
MTRAAAVLLPVAAMFGATVWSAAPAYAADCATRVASDFNGDGHADLAVGEPYRTVNGSADNGALRVLINGGSGDLVTAGNQYFDATTAGLSALIGDRGGNELGTSVTTGYFNDDCFADAAVGAPGTDRLLVLYGSVAGLAVDGAAVFELDDFGDEAATDVALGFTASSGDINGDGFDDIAVGMPNAAGGSGKVGILYGAAGGVTAAGAQEFTQNTTSVPGGNEAGDAFGFSVVLADLTGDGRADLAAGAPYENIGADSDTGMVIVFRSNGSTIQAAGSAMWTQETAGVPGASEDDDHLGFSLAAGDVNGDGRADLAIGHSGEAIGTKRTAGAVTILRGSTGGVTASSAQSFHQDSTNVPGTAEAGDGFGNAVTFGDYNRDGRADLGVAAANEAVGTKRNAGNVTVLYSNGTSLTGTGSKAFTQAGSVPGVDEADDYVGYWIGTLDGGPLQPDQLVVGGAGEDVGSFVNAGSVLVFKGGTAGITASAFYTTGLVNGAATDGWFGAGFA